MLCRMLNRIAIFCLPDVKTAIPCCGGEECPLNIPGLLLKYIVFCLTYLALLFFSIFAFHFSGRVMVYVASNNHEPLLALLLLPEC